MAGIILDVIESMISIKLGTGAELNLDILFTTVLVVIPFAVLTELVIDHPNFWNKVLRLKKN